MPQIDRDALDATLRAELRAAWTTLRGRHPGERFYSFGLYTTELADCLSVTAGTEEGLSEVSQRYGTGTGGDPAAQRVALRWSPTDSPLHAEGRELLVDSDRLCREGPEPSDDTPEADEAIALIFDVAIQALRQLDAEGVFGAGVERAQLVLGIWKGDQSDEERIEFASLLNPRPVAERFAREIAEQSRVFFAAAAGPG
jgi:Domain of unknown function (DUF4303)